MRDIVLISDPRVVSIPVEESGERLSDVRGRLRADDRLADPEGAFAHLREGLLVRLEDAQAQLPPGYRLLVVEGYRPLATQRPRRTARLRRRSRAAGLFERSGPAPRSATSRHRRPDLVAAPP